MWIRHRAGGPCTQPAGSTIRLAVAVVKDHSDDHQPDPLLVLHGGPGGGIMQRAPSVAPLLQAFLGSRDMILFDQRGVGLSEPALECPEWHQNYLDTLDEADIDLRARTSYEAFMACRDRLIDEGVNLAAYNTTQSAADVQAIRLALGYDEINLYGGSYGSLLAQVVLREPPTGDTQRLARFGVAGGKESFRRRLGDGGSRYPAPAGRLQVRCGVRAKPTPISTRCSTT